VTVVVDLSSMADTVSFRIVRMSGYADINRGEYDEALAGPPSRGTRPRQQAGCPR